MARPVLTPSAAMEAKRLYAEVDERGKRVHTLMDIAEMLGVGETTIYRAVNARAAYGGLPPPKTADDARASEARFRAANPHLFEALPREDIYPLAEAAQKVPSAQPSGVINDVKLPEQYNFIEERSKVND